MKTPPDRSPIVSDEDSDERRLKITGEDLSVPDFSLKNDNKKIVELSLINPGKCLYIRAKLQGNLHKEFLIDSGASKSVIDTSVYDNLPDPKPFLNPTKTRFRVADGRIMEPLGVIHIPIIFYDEGEEQVRVTLPLFVCNLGQKHHCILGSDACARLNLSLDFANAKLRFDPKYLKKPLNCIAGRSNRLEAYQLKTIERTRIKAGHYAGVMVGTRGLNIPKQWRDNALAECSEELWEVHGLTISAGLFDSTTGVQPIMVINMNEHDVILRKGTVIAELSPYDSKVVKAEEKASGESIDIESMGSLFNIVGPDGQEEFTEEEQGKLYQLFGMTPPRRSQEKPPKPDPDKPLEKDPDKGEDEVSVKSHYDSDEESMDIVNYPDVIKKDKAVTKDQLPEALLKLLEDTKEGLTEEQIRLAERLLDNMQDTFMDPSTPLKGTSSVAHYIETGDHRPIRIPPRRISPGKRCIIEKEVAKMLEAGVIRASNSPWSSPVVLVTKVDGSTRFCIDYRKLNDITRKDSFPLPRIDDHLDRLRGKSWFCTLDLASGYWQIKMNEADKEKTAFASHVGLYEFNFMPFGLTNAPATFQRLMEKVLEGLINDACLLYLDDIIVYGDTFEEVYENLMKVMERLKKYNLKLKAKKCSLFKRSVKFLGHLVSGDGIACNPDKIKAVTDIGPPNDKTGVRSILGLGNYYRRFIKDYSLITFPLQQLTHSDAEFVWRKEHDESLEKLKTALTTAPVLAYPDTSEDARFIVDTDASDYQIGGVLSQIQNGEERVIMYASKGFQGSQMRWCTTRRELWAVVHMVTHCFSNYLQRRKFDLRTDHSSLRWLNSFARNANEALCRWLFFLEPYRDNMTILHRPGKKHGNADGLSRIRPITRSCPNPDCPDPGHKQPKVKVKHPDKVIDSKQDDLTALKMAAIRDLSERIDNGTPDLIPGYTNDQMRKAQQKDINIRRFMEIFLAHEEKPNSKTLVSEGTEVRIYCSLWYEMQVIDGILYRKPKPDARVELPRLVVPWEMRTDILQQMHDSIFAGHPGMSKMKATILCKYFWPHVTKEIENWVRCCERCTLHKRGARRRKFPLIQEISGAPFQRLAFDIIGPLKVTRSGNRYVLVMVDYFTKWAEAYPLPDRTAIGVANVMMTRWFATFGIPLKIHCDNGGEFKSECVKQVKCMLGVKGTYITPYRPKANGLVERTNATIEHIVMCMEHERRDTWDEALPYALMAYRATPHSTTGYTPNMLVFGQESNMPADLVYGRTTGLNAVPPVFRCYCHYVQELRKKIIRCHEIARDLSGKAAIRQKRIHDEETAPRHFKSGDVVWLFEKRLGAKPLCMGWTGKFVIIKKTGPANYRIAREEHGKQRVVHVDNLRLHYDQTKPNWVKLQKQPPEKGVQVDTERSGKNQDTQISKEEGSKKITKPTGRKGKSSRFVPNLNLRRSARIAAQKCRKAVNIIFRIEK